MILGVGIDLCDIERMGRAIEKGHFVDRVFAPAEAERVRAASELRRPELAAGLFAANEAVAKALGTGFNGFGAADVEIVPDAAGRPCCTLRRGALERANALAQGQPFGVWVSITHEKGYAAAMAILELGVRNEE